VHIIDTVLLPIELPAPEDSMAPAPAPMEADNDIEMPDDMAQGPTPAVISARRIYKSVVSAIDNEGLTSLAAALAATDLAGSLGPTFNGTVFAPTNDVRLFLPLDGSISTPVHFKPCNLRRSHPPILELIVLIVCLAFPSPMMRCRPWLPLSRPWTSI
jgi:hypothetical protein